MPKLRFHWDTTEVDYAVKGTDYIVGYKDGLEICRYDGIADFAQFRYDSEFRSPNEDVNEKIKESEDKLNLSDEAMIELFETVEKLSDRLDSALIEASFGDTSETSAAFARQIAKGAFDKRKVPTHLQKEVEMYLRSF